MNTHRLFFLHFGRKLLTLKLFFALISGPHAVAAISGKTEKTKELQPFTVIIDPGHGGHDTGSIGKWSEKSQKRTRKLVEKEVVLDLAERVKMVLENPKFTKALGRPLHVLMTREKDQFVSLDARALMARQKRADLFISLHANSERTGTVRGFEIYYLDNSSKESYSHHEILNQRRLEQKQNNYDDPRLALLFRSVATDSTLKYSKIAARTLQRSLLGEMKHEGFTVPDRGIRKALLQVLLDAETPGILVEALYLSNAEDRALIERPDARDAIANGIARGILKYLIVAD